MAEALRLHGTDPGSAGVPSIALAVRQVSKRFGAVTANDDINFDIAAGTIHAIVGENGAGKTTLMRIIYGLYEPDRGWLELDGERVVFKSPREALARGVGMVHQHSLLLDGLTVAENVMLALPGGTRPRRQKVLRRLHELAEENGLQLDPGASVAALSVGARQRAEILSALFHGARVLIRDEPTTVLTPQEVAGLFDVLRRLHSAGTTVVVVTHKLVEVMALSQRVSVLRGGRLVETLDTAGTSERDLVRLMVGREVPSRARDDGVTIEAGGRSGEPLLSLVDLCVRDSTGMERVRGVDLHLAAGEIVAVTGVEGNGQAELTDAVVGATAASGGQIRLRGEAVTRWPIGKRRRAGLAYVPEERMLDAISGADSVRDNLVLGRHARRPFARLGVRNLRATNRAARQLISDFAISAPSPDSAAATLSGGNLQKVVVARELAERPLVLVAAQPTQGVDVAASHMIRSTLVSLRDEGVGILLVSSDLSEVCDIADRAVVLYNGVVIGELAREELSEQTIGFYAMGCPEDA